MPVKNSIRPIPLTSVSATTFNGTDYMPINPGGLPNACFYFTIINNSSGNVLVSYDGITAHDFIPSASSAPYPIQTNSQPNTFIANLAKGTIVYVLGSVGTGDVYLSGFYQQQA